MTRNDLASTPAEDSPPTPVDLLTRLERAIEALAQTAADPELKCHTPAEAAELLGKTENWVIEAIQDGRIPCTRIGKSPRLTAAHIRWIQAHGERMPNKYAKDLAA